MRVVYHARAGVRVSGAAKEEEQAARGVGSVGLAQGLQPRHRITYPYPTKRAVWASSTSHVLTQWHCSISKDALDTILDRLQRIERQQQAQSSTGASPRSTITTTSGLAASIGPSPSSYDAPPAPLLLGNTPQAPSQYVQPSSWLDPSRSALLCPGLPEAVTAWPADPADHAMKVMCDAMECVHRLQLQSFGSSIVTDEIKVPAHLARTWMRSRCPGYVAQCPFGLGSCIQETRGMSVDD